MAAKGVTEERVFKAADDLLVAGQRPTIERVRAALGSGSQSTLIRHMDAWWKVVGARLTEAVHRASVPTAPPELAAAFSEIWLVALAKAREIADAQVADTARQLGEDRIELERQKTEAARSVSEAHERAAEAALAADRSRLLADGLASVRDALEARIGELDATLARERSDNERLRKELRDALARIEDNHRAWEIERKVTASHARSVEDRAHQEVDRARTETTRLNRRVAELEQQARAAQSESGRRIEALGKDLRRTEASRASLNLKVVKLEQLIAELRAKIKDAKSIPSQRPGAKSKKAKADAAQNSSAVTEGDAQSPPSRRLASVSNKPKPGPAPADPSGTD